MRIAEQTQGDIMLIDLSTPGGGRNARRSCKRNRKIELTDEVTKAMNNGAMAYVLSGGLAAELC